MHTHHSHSGQYVQHAHDSLEEVVEAAAAKGYHTFCLTEHMPRYGDKELYPEEIESKTSVDDLANTFDQYYAHARRLQAKYAEAALAGGNEDGSNVKFKLLVGFESESISDQYPAKVKELRAKYKFDLVVGSVHHVNGIPIDYGRELWLQGAAISLAAANTKTTPTEATEHSDEELTRAMFSDYFDIQYQMLQTTRPSVVGHFDLIRLFAAPRYLEDGVLQNEWPEVWAKIVRNVRYAIAQGKSTTDDEGAHMLFELNSAAVRKGWDTPYPRPDIARLIVQEGGRFCLSDDSHGIDQIGLNYHKCLKYLEQLGADTLYHLDLENGKTVVRATPLETVKADDFWIQYSALD